MKISQLKWNIQTIVTSLGKLQMHRDNISQNPKNLSSEIVEISKCRESLENAFSYLESESVNKLVRQVQKRKTKRYAKKLKTKKKYGEMTKSRSHCQNNLSANIGFVSEEPTLKCLETLHRLRGGGDSCKLKESLNSIKSIWQSTEHCINEEINDNSFAKRWDKVLFGGKSEVEMQPGLGEFVERRFIWDTYLDSSNGSHIPVGWVYPKEDARSEWKEFLQLT